MTLDRATRAEGGLLGLLVGDALGVPYEFHTPEALPPEAQIELAPPAGFRRSHHPVPPGTWSDDGAQALALLDTLRTCGRFDADDFGRRLLAWWHEGRYDTDGRPFDIGNQTSDALARLEAGVPAAQAGGRGERDNGNGSLMRVLPLALWHGLTDADGDRADGGSADGDSADADLVRDAHDQSDVTHAHPRSEVCCALYCLWARGTLREVPDPWGDAVVRLKRVYAGTDHATELDRVLAPYPPRGTGYVLDCLHSARAALEAPTYEQVVRRAIRFGYDTDTTAAVAGGIAGLRHGPDGIPARWRAALRGREILDPLVAALRARA